MEIIASISGFIQLATTMIDKVAIVLINVGGFFAILNWFASFESWRTGRFVSGVPLIGGMLLAGGMLLMPATRPYAWTAVFVDRGTLTLVLAIPFCLKEYWKTSRFNLVEEYEGRQGNRAIRLRLYHEGEFTLAQEIERPPGEAGIRGVSIIGKWSRNERKLILQVGAEFAQFVPVPNAQEAQILQLEGFDRYESSELSLDGIVLKLRSERAV